MTHFELVIFDCDGVLVDSERTANEAFAKIVFEECALSLSLDDMFEHFVGRSGAQCMDILEQMLGRAPPQSLKERYEVDINTALQHSVTGVTGIEQALAELNLPYCVASSGSYEKMHMTLGRANLLALVHDRLFSTSDVARGKPFPDIYLHAANAMGCADPGKCLVIEDSPVGVCGAVAAGMSVFGYAELMSGQRLIDAGAHRTFTDMRLLSSEIAAYEQSLR